MQVALYARVSTERQEQQGTVASQLDALTRWACEQHHDVVDAYVCVDDGYSGARLDRPGLDRLRDGADAGAFEAALVLCPDRLARKYAYQILILEELERFGVQVIFLDQPLSDDPQARLLTQIQGAVAEYERIKIAERYRRGKLFRARQGEVCWGKVPYGYRRIPRRDGVPAHVEVSEPEAQVVRQIFRWHVDEHLSVRQITLRLTESPYVTATGLPRWGTGTVTRMLHNEAYIGTMYYNRRESIRCESKSASRRRRPSMRYQDRPAAEWIPLPVPPIIDAELFRRSQAIHYDNSRFSPRHLKSGQSGHYLLRRLVRCRVCDLAMSCHRMRGSNGTFHHYYYCVGHDVLVARRAIGPCPQRNLRSDELDALVWSEVRRHLENPALIREGYARLQAQGSPGDDGMADELAALKKQLAELDREEHRLLDAYQAGLVDLEQLRQRQGRLRQRRAHVNGSIEVLHTERKTAQQQAQLQADLETFVDRIRGPLATLDFDARQQLVRTVLERVMVEDGRVDIHFAIPLPEPPPDTTNPSVSAHFRLRSSGNDWGRQLPVAGRQAEPGAGLRQGGNVLIVPGSCSWSGGASDGDRDAREALAALGSGSTSRTVNRGRQPAARVRRYAPALQVTAAADRAGSPCGPAGKLARLQLQNVQLLEHRSVVAENRYSRLDLTQARARGGPARFTCLASGSSCPTAENVDKEGGRGLTY